MKTTVRTALLGLVIAVAQTSFSSAADPTSVPPTPDSGSPDPAAASSASETPIPGNPLYDSTGNVSMRDTIGRSVPDPFGPTFHLDGWFGDGVGWKDNSYQFDMYYPWHVNPGESAFFGVLQQAVTDNSRGYGNAGAGYRHYEREWDRIFGAWAWFDWDTSHVDDYYRYGVSFESLGKYLDFRFNWYWLSDQQQNIVSNNFVGTPFFSGNNIIGNRQIVSETPFDGGDLEVGGPLPFLGRYGVYGHAGVYYVHSDAAGDAVGGMGRIDVAATDNIAVGVQIARDDLFDMTTNVQVSWTLPDGVPTRWFKPRPVRERLNSQVVRKDRIPVLRESVIHDEALLNPRDGEPFFVVHVDPNDAAGTGTGTFENPYGDLEQARDVNNANIDVFRIIPRADGSGTNLRMDGNFVLFDYQKVFGSSVSHSLTTVQGVFDIPPFPGPGPLPLVSNGAITPGDNVFQLANANEISGIHIRALDATAAVRGNGIGNAAPITDFNLNQNEFSEHINAVALVNATGTGIFDANTITGTPGSSVDGFQLTNSNAGVLDLTVTGSTSTLNDGNGFNVATAGAAAVINATFSDNTANENGTGFQFTTAPGTINLEFDGNTANDNVDTSTGVHVTAAGGIVNVDSFTDNTVVDNVGNGVWFEATDAAGGGTIIVRNFQGNTITGNGTAAGTIDPDGLLMSADGALALVDAEIGVADGTPNTITGNGLPGVGGAGVHIMTTNSGTVRGNIVNNNISNNVGAFGVFADGNTGVIDFGTLAGRLIDDNTINGNPDAGIFVRLRGDATGRFIITNNEIGGTTDGPDPLASGEGIHFRTEDTSELLFADVENNFVGVTANGSVNPNASHGAQFEFFQNSQAADIQIRNNLFRFNLGDGLNFRRNGDALLDNVIIQTNTLTNNVGDGLDAELAGGDIDISGGGPLVIDFTINQDNVFSDNGGNGLRLHSLADADFRILLDDNTITGNVLDGVNAQTQFFSQIRGTWSNNLIAENGVLGSGVGGNGISLTDVDSSLTSFDLTIANNTIRTNVADGIHYETLLNIPLGGGVGTVNVNENLIKNNGGDGVDVHTIGTAVANVNLNDTVVQANEGAGVTMFASDISAITTNSTGNTIEFNGADGWNLTTSLQSSTSIFHSAAIDAVLTDNIIRFNAGRGVNILNQWDADMRVVIQGTVDPRPNGNVDSSLIDSNGLQGILVTNEADATRAFELGIFTSNTLKFSLFQTEVRGNGTNAVAADDGNGVYVRVGTSGFGFVEAAIEDNHFSGNSNIDVVTESFVATREPGAFERFNPDGSFKGIALGSYEPDPVARLDLRLQGNVGQQIDVTRLGAFYDNNDEFKSVVGTFDRSPLVPGSYSFDAAAADRRRNAQRFALDAYALNASPTTLDAVSALPVPTTTVFGSANGIITADDIYIHAAIEGIQGVRRIIDSSTATAPAAFTVSLDYPVAPAIGDTFTVRAYDQAGVGDSTFRTEDASVATNNTFDSILSDFSTQIAFPVANGNEAPFTYTWATGFAFGSPFPP